MVKSPEEFAPWLGVFETLRVVRGVPLFVAEHYAELLRAAEELGLAVEFDPVAALRELPGGESGRWRWVVTADGTRTLFTREEPAAARTFEIAVSPVRVGSANWDARFKTVSYLAHAQAAKRAGEGEAVLLNERGEVASAARSNIFWVRGGRLFTPAHEAGCRCGVVRRFIVEQYPVNQGRFMLSELLEADEIFLTNSMRGLVSVTLMQGKAVSSSDVADKLRVWYDAEIARQLG